MMAAFSRLRLLSLITPVQVMTGAMGVVVSFYLWETVQEPLRPHSYTAIMTPRRNPR